MNTSLKLALALFAALAAFATAQAETASPAGAKVYFINLQDGAALTGPFLVQFGLSGMALRLPACRSRIPGIIIC